MQAKLAGTDDVEVMRLLIAHGARPSADSAKLALTRGNLRCLEPLVNEYGLEIPSEPSPVCLAAEHIAVMRWLVQRGYAIDGRGPRGNAYAHAVEGEALGSIKWLYRHGLRDGRAAAFLAAENKRARVLESLLSLQLCSVDEKTSPGISYASPSRTHAHTRTHTTHTLTHTNTHEYTQLHTHMG